MMTVFHNPVLIAIGEALLHSLWQGFVIFLILKAMLYLFRNESSAMKYSMSVIALASIFISFVVTFFICMSPPIFVEGQPHYSSPPLLITTLPVSHSIQSSQWSDSINFNIVIENFLPFYFIGMIILLLKTIISYFNVRVLRLKSVIEIDEWKLNCERLIQRFNLSSNIKIFFSERVDVPMMMGFFKPTILLPLAIVNNLNTEQVEAIIMHELAHIKRNDYIINILQNIIEAVFFFNPFVWIISNEIRTERENSCDDLVLSSQSNPVNYAEALYTLECNRLNSYTLSLGAANNKKHLLKRIRRIMETRNRKINSSSYILAACLVILSFISIAWLVPQDTLQNKKVSKNTKALIAVPPAPPKPPAGIFAPPAPPVLAPASMHEIAPPAEIPEVPVVPALAPVPPDSSKKGKHQITFIDDDGSIRQYKSYDDIPEADRKRVEAEMERAQEQMEKSRDEIERVNEQMKKMDFEKMDREMKITQKEYKRAMKSVDMEKMQRELEMADAGIQKLNSLEMKKEMEELMKLQDLKKLEMDEMRSDMENEVKHDTDKKLKLAMVEMGKAMKEKYEAETKRNVTDKNVNSMIAEMEGEKLISKKAGFVIEKISGDLYINNEKQSSMTNEKYSKYLGKKDIRVKGKNDDLQISFGNSENED